MNNTIRILHKNIFVEICSINSIKMESQSNINYHRVAAAIHYIQNNFKSQPNIDEVAQKIHLSPSHFKKVFTDWAGTSPKRFLQFISVEYAKKILSQQQATLFDTAFETGFSSTSRLHDLFINLEGMTPAEYKNGAANLNINYSFSESPFGNLLVATTEKGICFMAFEESKNKALLQLREKFPNAHFQEKADAMQQNALRIFQNDWSKLAEIKLHLRGTHFQLKVWEALLKIPMGKLATYGQIADGIGNPKASRAVGTAIGNNPVAFLIPCHRVIQSSGSFGGYRWDPVRKSAMIGWEAAKTDTEK